MPAPPPPLPTFLIIGAQKSATRWLRHTLGQHPQVFTAPQEVKFFNHPTRMAALGTDWYRAQFDGWAGEPLVGESTPGYLMWRHGPAEVAQRIDTTIADVRLLAVLRNPVDRAQSALVHHRRRQRIHPDVRLVDLVREVPPEQDWMGLVSGGWYGASLAPYRERFGDRLRVLLHDDLRSDPAALYDEAVRHVGAADGFMPPSLHEVMRSNQGDDDGEGSPTADERRELFEYFRPDIERLEGLLGRDLSMWRP